DAKAQKVLKEILDTYSDTLSIGIQDPEIKDRVRKLFEDTKAVLSLKPDDPKRQALLTRLIGLHQKGADELLLDTLSSDPNCTDRAKKNKEGKQEENGDPPDEEAAANRALVAKLGKQSKLADVSEQERIAAMQCLILLSTKEDGTIPEKGVIASREIKIPE